MFGCDNSHSKAFLSFYFAFNVNLKGAKGHYCKLYFLNII